MKRALGWGVTVAAALGSVGLGHWYLTRLEAEIAGGDLVPVLVAATDLAVGHLLGADDLAVRDVPEAYLEERHVRAKEAAKVTGARVVVGLKASEAVLWSDLDSEAAPKRALAGLIQPGMRAVALDSRATRFRGLLRPGDRVDVLFTADPVGSPGATRTLLQNLLVLSVGGELGADSKLEKKARSGSDGVILSATVEQSQVLVHAEGQGTLTLTVRNGSDATLVEGLLETRADRLLEPASENAALRARGL